MPTIKSLAARTYDAESPFGFYASFDPTLHQWSQDIGWISPWHYSLNQGLIVLMIENYRNQFVWRLMCDCPFIRHGLARAGFRGGWLART